MSATIKVNGSGPLLGKTFYGTRKAEGNGKITLVLDEPPFDSEAKEFDFSLSSGYLVHNSVECELLRMQSNKM